MNETRNARSREGTDPAGGRASGPGDLLDALARPVGEGVGEGAGEAAPGTPAWLAAEAIRVICAAGVEPGVGERTYRACRRALDRGATARIVLRHPGKSAAIDHIWRERNGLFAAFRAAPDPLAFLQTLPWIGARTHRRLAHALDLVPAPGFPAAPDQGAATAAPEPNAARAASRPVHPSSAGRARLGPAAPPARRRAA